MKKSVELMNGVRKEEDPFVAGNRIAEARLFSENFLPHFLKPMILKRLDFRGMFL